MESKANKILHLQGLQEKCWKDLAEFNQICYQVIQQQQAEPLYSALNHMRAVLDLYNAYNVAIQAVKEVDDNRVV